jgi:hypothetical protein
MQRSHARLPAAVLVGHREQCEGNKHSVAADAPRNLRQRVTKGRESKTHVYVCGGGGCGAHLDQG